MAGFSQTLTAEANREADANLGAVRSELAAITGEPIP
jgi:hypothetical protein